MSRRDSSSGTGRPPAPRSPGRPAAPAGATPSGLARPAGPPAAGSPLPPPARAAGRNSRPGLPRRQREKIPLQDAYGTVWIHLLPFLRPAVVRHALPERAEEVMCTADAVRIALEQDLVDEQDRNVILAHQFVTGAKRCDAEELQVGDLDQIPAELFEKFDYAALGHIHSPQKVERDTVRYCGSPLKYSFSEAGQEKTITVIKLKEKGTVELRTIPLKPLHDLRKIRGTYLEVTAKTFYENSDCEDYLLVTLTDEEDVPDGMAKLRTIYPNLMRLEYDNKRTRSAADIGTAERVEEKSELELFREFYELQNNQSMTAQQKALVEELLRGMKA